MEKILKMVRDLNQYFKPDSIFRFDDDDDFSETQNSEENSDSSEETKENGDVFVSRKDTSRETTKKINIANYFSHDSIYRSSDDENDEIDNGVQIRSKPNSPPLRDREGMEPKNTGDIKIDNNFSPGDIYPSPEEKDREVEQVKILFKPKSLPQQKNLRELQDMVPPSFSGNKNFPSKSPKSSKKKSCTFHQLKELVSSKCKDLQSAVGAVMRGASNCSLQLVSTFYVREGCAKVSSITKYDHGQCWVAADQSESILLYDREGNLVDLVNAGCPVDSLTTDKDGNVFMSCPDLKQIRVFDRNRHDVKTFLDMTEFPRGIAYMQSDDSILVCRNDVKIAHSNLTEKACNPLEKYLIRGRKYVRTEELMDIRFGYPFRVCVNKNSDCVVSDFANRTITVLDPKGRTRFCFKSSKDFPILNRHSICCDPEGNIYFISKGKPNVCILESDGNVKDLFSCIDLCNESVFAAVFDSDGFLWTACLDGFIKIFKKV